MKAKDLAKLLLEYPEFEVETSINIIDPTCTFGLHTNWYNVEGITEIGHSDHILVLDLEEKSNGKI